MSLSRLNSNGSLVSHGYWALAVPVTGIVFTLLVLATGINESLFIWLNGLSRYTGTTIWEGITLFGDGLVAFVLILPLVHRRPDVVWQLFIAALVAALASNGLKQVFTDVHRPPGVLDPGTFITIGPVFKHHSFPSGHTTTAFTLAGVLALWSGDRRIRVLLIAAASLVGLSRIMIGVHWPADIFAGAAIGWGAAWTGIALGGRFPLGAKRPGQHVLGILLFTAALVLVIHHHTGYDRIVWFQRTLAAACLIGGIPVLRELARECGTIFSRQQNDSGTSLKNK